MTEPIQIHAKITRWAKFGSKIRRKGPPSSNSHSKKKHYLGILAENAMSLGWLNGKRIRRR